MRQLILLLTLFALVAISANAQQPEWYRKIKEINFLSNNYDDVIRVFDLASKVKNDPDAFHRGEWGISLPDGRVHVWFQPGRPCTSGSKLSLGWNIPQGTVVMIEFFPEFEKPITVQQLPFSVAGFDVYALSERTFLYLSAAEGIRVDAYGNSVNSVTFFARDDMSYMRCDIRQSKVGFID